MNQPFDQTPQSQNNSMPSTDPLLAALQGPFDPSNQQTQAQPAPATPAPAAQQPQQASPPSPRPILLDFIKGLVHPQAQNLAANRPTSRVDVLENFLGNFVQALGAGFSQARGPGAGLRGAAAAMGAPYQADLQRFQLGQQSQLNQAELAQRQAQTSLTQQQAAFLPTQQGAQLQAMSAQPRWDPNTREFIGTMTDAAFANYVKGQGAAKQNALSKQAQADLAAGKVAKYLPTQDGRYLALDAKGNPLHVVDGAIDPQMMQRYSSTQKLVSDGAGGFLVVPVTTTSGVAPTGLQQLQARVPGLAANQTAQGAVQQKVPALGAAAPSSNTPHHIYTNANVIAVDPQTNERVVTSASDAAQKGYTNPMPVKQGDVEKYRESAVQFNDVELKLDRYLSAAKAFDQLPTSTQAKDHALIQQIINKAGAFDFNVQIGQGGKLEIPLLSSFLEASSRETNSAAYSSLSPEGKELVNGYIGSMAAVPAFVKALTNTGRTNKEVIDLELAQIPNPTMAMGDIARKMLAFKENVTQGYTGIPRIPGIPTLKDIRQKFETQELPANIQQLISQPWSHR